MKVPSIHHRRPGFTLVELLVVIGIVLVLATIAFIFARQGLGKATAAKALERLRQSGSVLIGNAQEKGGRFEFAVSDEPPTSDFLPYNIVRRSLEIDYSSPRQTENQLCEIMHWDVKKLKPVKYVRNCFGVNFTEITGGAEGTDVKWKDDSISSDSGYIPVRTLMQSSLGRPERYPLLMESSDAKGDEIFYIRESEGARVGLRDMGKTQAFFMDGSARPLDKRELKNCGFTNVYDNSTRPPKGVKL
jgi:prepilin-type N-terminal cleavage/methylation domain-containing protein